MISANEFRPFFASGLHDVFKKSSMHCMLYCSKSHTVPIIQLQANQIETTGDIAVKLGQFFFFFRIISVNKNIT